VGAAARAYHRIISDPASGLDVDRPGDVREVGVLEMVPVGDLVVGDFVGLGPDRKHSAEALDVLFGYWAGAVTVARDGG
jgi:hypothetical protein